MNIPDAPHLVLRNASVPRALLRLPAAPDGDTVALDIVVEQGRIARLAPAGTVAGEAVDLDRGMVWPCFVDLHTHLDKGHIWPRAPNPDGTRAGALAAVAADRETNWNAEDVRARMDFALRCAYAQGTRGDPHASRFDRPAAVDLLAGISRNARGMARPDRAASCRTLPSRCGGRRRMAGRASQTLVAESGGVMGGVPYMRADVQDYLGARVRPCRSARPGSRFPCRRDRRPGRGDAAPYRADRDFATVPWPYRGRPLLQHRGAGARRGRPHARSCRRGRDRRGQPADVQHVSAGPHARPHATLARRDAAARDARARHQGDASPATIAATPFYAYGDHDLVEVYREATRIAHLDHPVGDWPRRSPPRRPRSPDSATWCVAEGAPADLVLFRARTFNEFLTRPQADRVVLRAGRPIDRTLPDYRELDYLMGTP